MPFAGYEDFAACVAANQDKDDPEAYCGALKNRVEKHGSHNQDSHGNWVDAPDVDAPDVDFDVPDYIGDAESRGAELSPEVMERHSDVFNMSDDELREAASVTFEGLGDPEMAARHNVVQVEMRHRRETGEAGLGELSVQQDLVDKIQRDGGFTYSPSSGESPDDGYMVGIYEDAEEVHGVEDVDLDLLRDYVARHRSKLEASSNHLGAWIDRETGEVYLDISMRTESEDTARRLGEAADQIAIFDLGGMEEIRLKRAGAGGRAVTRLLLGGGMPSDQDLARLAEQIRSAA